MVCCSCWSMTYGTVKLLSSVDKSSSVKFDAVPLPPGVSSNRCHTLPCSWLIALGSRRGTPGSDRAPSGRDRAPSGSPKASSGSSGCVTLKRKQMAECYVIHSSIGSTYFSEICFFNYGQCYGHHFLDCHSLRRER